MLKLSGSPGRKPVSLWGVSLVMFLSFAGLSVTQFHGYLFQRMGFTPFRIGILLCAGFAAGIVAPIVQVTAIRRLRGPRAPLFIVFTLAALAVIAVPHLRGFLPVVTVFSLIIFCSASVHPLTAACALEVTRSRGPATYFLIRCLGTIGFLGGCIVSYFYPRPEFLSRLYLGFGAAFILALIAAAWGLRPQNPKDAPEDIFVTPHPRRTPSFRRALRLLSAPRPQKILWALGLFNFANAMATLVQGNYLATRFPGGQRSISLAWIIGTSVEVPLMLLCAWWVRRSGLRVILALGLLGTGLKLVLMGVANTREVFFLGLAFHGCFFSGAMVGFNLYVDQKFPVADRPALQALGSLFYQGLPTAFGGLAAGTLWHFFGLRSVYGCAAAIGIAMSVYTLYLLPQLPARAGSQGLQ